MARDDGRAPVPGARLIVSGAEVRHALDRLASDLQPAVAAGDCILLGVLLGGLFPLVELARRLEGDFVIDVCRVSRYGDSMHGALPRWLSAPSIDPAGRHVIVVDDIHDQGVTLDFVVRRCLELGARRASTAVLVRKQHGRQLAQGVPDYAAIDVGDEFVFGCGMDYRGHWRHLAALWAVPGSTDPDGPEAGR